MTVQQTCSKVKLWLSKGRRISMSCYPKCKTRVNLWERARTKWTWYKLWGKRKMTASSNSILIRWARLPPSSSLRVARLGARQRINESRRVWTIARTSLPIYREDLNAAITRNRQAEIYLETKFPALQLRAKKRRKWATFTSSNLVNARKISSMPGKSLSKPRLLSSNS